MAARKEQKEAHVERQHVLAARDSVRTVREKLRARVDDIARGCQDAPRIAMDRLRARFDATAKKLQAPDLDPDKELFDERFTKRVERATTAGCRLNARTARIEAEPEIRAGKAARKKHRATEKASQERRRQERERGAPAGAVPRGAKPAGAVPAPKPAPASKTGATKRADDTKRGKASRAGEAKRGGEAKHASAAKPADQVTRSQPEADKAIVRELEADPETAKLVPIWMKVREQMHGEAEQSGGKLTPLEAFVQYVDKNLAAVERELSEQKKAGSEEKRASRRGAASRASTPRRGGGGSATRKGAGAR